MALTYEWEITTLKKINTQNLQDVVVQAYWTKTGTNENGTKGVFSSATSFTLSDEFTQFEELTNEIILGWIQTNTSNSTDLIIASIQKQIDNIESSVTKMPWDTFALV